jgi:hypothetical protein
MGGFGDGGAGGYERLTQSLCPSWDDVGADVRGADVWRHGRLKISRREGECVIFCFLDLSLQTQLSWWFLFFEG